MNEVEVNERFKRRSAVALSAILTGAVSVSALIVGGILSPADAAVGICRSDPVFNLSNGMTVTLYETMTDDPSDIIGGSYSLHIPNGTYVTSVDYSGTLGVQQSFSYFADSTSNVYSATSTVMTTTDAVPLTAYMTVGAGRTFSHGKRFATKQQYQWDTSTQGEIQSTSTDGASNTPIANSISYQKPTPNHQFVGMYDAADSTDTLLVMWGWHAQKTDFTLTDSTVYIQNGQPVTAPTLTNHQFVGVRAQQQGDGSWQATTVVLFKVHQK